MESFIVYKFPCATCSSSYVSKTCSHFKTRIVEHIKKDNKSHIFKHLQSSETCFDSYNCLCFKIIDKGNSKFNLKIKKLYKLTGENLKCKTKWFNPHPFTIASVLLARFCLFFIPLFFAFLFHLLLSLSVR